MAVTFQDYINELKNSRVRQPLVKLEFLRQDETPLKEVVTDLRLQGSISIQNKNGVRRSMDMTLDNTLKQYFPSLDSSIWMASKVKIYLGLMIGGESYFLSQGVYVMNNPTTRDDLSTDLNGLDKYSLLDGSLGGELQNTIIIPNTTSLGNAIRTVMTISQDDKPPIIDISIDSESIPYDIIHEEGSTIGDILEELAFAFSCNVYYNEDGYLVFEKDTSDSDKGSIWNFDANSDSETNYQDASTEYDLSKVYNSFLIIGDNINGNIVRATVKNEDLLSNTSIPNVGFERVKVIKDNIINTVFYAEQRGIYELKRATNVLTSSRLSCVPIYHLDVDKVIRITDDRQNMTDARKLIESITIPLDNSGDMSLNVVDTFDINV